mgnify:CR=1 FL=1
MNEPFKMLAALKIYPLGYNILNGSFIHFKLSTGRITTLEVSDHMRQTIFYRRFSDNVEWFYSNPKLFI